MTDLLEHRFAALGDSDRGDDWDDVVERARRRPRRLRRRALAIALALAVVIAAPALAIRGIVHFFSSEPAPPRIVRQFAQLDVGAPKAFAPGVRADETRSVGTFRLPSGRAATLYVAPTRSGGFCFAFEPGGSGGCRPTRTPAIDAAYILASPDGPGMAAGNVAGDADELELAYANGDRVKIPLTYVTKPIDAAFFLAQLAPGRDAVTLSAYRDGKLVDRQTLPRPEPPETVDPETGTPSLAIASQRRVLIAFTTEQGRHEVLWTAPERGGGRCVWLTVDGHPGRMTGCPPPTAPLLPPNLVGAGLLGGNAPVLFEGEVGANVAEVELRFEDGGVIRLPPIEGNVFAEIPSSHWPRGHRLDEVVGLDVNGNAVSRRRFETDVPGTYPCVHRVDIGAGVRACP